ncbi:hypothetical protein DPSP01_003059 [Paraphaeosphaeria sporulosa]
MSTYFSYTTITADVDPATEWVTVTSEALRTGRRGESTIFSTSTVSDVEWTTSCDTRIAALNAKTTVTSTATLRLQPGETGLPYAEDDEDVVGSGAGNTVRRKYISSAARAGIGVDVALVIAGIAAIIGYFVKKRKNKKTATAAGAGAEIPMIIRNQSYNGPSQNPSGSPTTMFD